MALAIANGLIRGDGDRLHPVAKVTRAQFGLVVYRADALDPAAITLPDPVDPKTDTSPAGQPSSDASTGDAPAPGDDTISESLTPAEKAQADFMDTYSSNRATVPSPGRW